MAYYNASLLFFSFHYETTLVHAQILTILNCVCDKNREIHYHARACDLERNVNMNFDQGISTTLILTKDEVILKKKTACVQPLLEKYCYYFRILIHYLHTLM